MADHEKADLTPSLARFLAAALVTLIVVAALVVELVRPQAVHDRDLRKVLIPMPEPQLQTDPRDEMRRFQAEEMKDLEGYGWADKDRRLARIPIEAAMARIARDGIPDWPVP